jgi:hypothetical protein
MRRTNGGFEFVAGSDPNLDTSSLEVRNSLGHTILQLVFDGRGTEQAQILLDTRADFLNEVLPVVSKRNSSLMIALIPLVVLVLCRKKKAAESAPSSR